MSVEELAARTGLSVRVVSYARAGYRVSPDTADAIAAVVDVDRAALVFAPRTRAAA